MLPGDAGFGQQVDTALSGRYRIGILNPGSGYPNKNYLMVVFSSVKAYSVPKSINMESIERAHVPKLKNISFICILTASVS